MPVNAKMKLEKIIEKIKKAPSVISKQELEKIIINEANVISNLGKKSYIDSLISLDIIKKGHSGFVNLLFKSIPETLEIKKKQLKFVEASATRIKKEIKEMEDNK